MGAGGRLQEGVRLTRRPRSPSTNPTLSHGKAAGERVRPAEPGGREGLADLHFGVPAEPGGT